MTNTEKSKIVANSLSLTIEKSKEQFGNITKKKIKRMLKNNEYIDREEVMLGIMTEAMMRLANDIKTWEAVGIAKLNGLTPKEYHNSLESINDVIDLVSYKIGDFGAVISPSLAGRIKELEDLLSDKLLAILENIQLGDNKCLDAKQLAAVKITEIIVSPKFINVIIDIFSQLDNEKTDKETSDVLTQCLIDIGQPALEPLINMIENNQNNDRLHPSSIITVASIARENKSDDIFYLLKNFFRNSENKLPGAIALSTYGDGRAIPAIRGYIEKNLDEISCEEYGLLRNAILMLGGSTYDLDEYFEDYEDEDYEDEDYEDEDYEDEDYEDEDYEDEDYED